MSLGVKPEDWDFLYAQIIASTGWDWGQVDALTIPRYRALKRYWQDHPPTHLLLRALLGIKTPNRRDEPAAPFDALAAMAPAGRLSVNDLARAQG